MSKIKRKSISDTLIITSVSVIFVSILVILNPNKDTFFYGPSAIVSTPAPTSYTTPTPKPWQTYKSDKNGFELQYPSSYSIRTDLESALELWGPIISVKNGFKRLIISINTVPKDDSQKPNQICYFSGCIFKNSLTKIIINKIPAWQSDEYENADGVILKNNKIRYIYIEKPNVIIVIRQDRFVEKENEFLTPLNQILSTFKFTK